VKPMRRALTGAVVLGLGVAGCTAAAHIGALQPPVLATPAHAIAPLGLISVPEPAIQLGAGIDLYTYRGQDFARSSTTEVAYLRALHANAVTVSFPFFIHGINASRIYARNSTPTPAQLAVLATDAMRAGIYVVLRPLMDETILGEPRSLWRPSHPRAWFASYQRFLLPYAAMAQRVGITKLYVGAEFTKFSRSRYWNGLDKALRRVFKGTLLYANNGRRIYHGSGGRGVRLTFDAYPALHVPARATVRQLTRAWEAYDRSLPRRAVLSEVGIAGVLGAYGHPWKHQWSNPRMDPSVQTRWFEAACRAVAAEHMGGIYFWAIGFGKDELSTRLSRKNQAAWEVGPSERAVAACFSQISHG